jgi:hypothetical protein
MEEKNGSDQSKTNRPLESSNSGQYRISTLISWTTVIMVAIVGMDLRSVLNPIDPNIDMSGELVGRILIGFFFFCPALSCIPVLVDKLLDKTDEIAFGTFTKVWLCCCVGAFSCLSLLLSGSFTSSWKGDKGDSWFYVTLEGYPAMTFYPIYLLGAILFSMAVVNRHDSKYDPIILFGVFTNALISGWYTAAVFFFRFTHDELMFAIVPGSCGVCYLLLGLTILKHQKYVKPFFQSSKYLVLGWSSFLFVSVMAKYPLARRLYDQLPDEPPQECFVVTAASKGHPQLVGAWTDKGRGRLVNQQLLTLWKLEDWLTNRFPLFHRRLRKIYNRLGPTVARRIRYRWQADLVYLFLKPLEYLAVVLVRRD